MPSRPTREDTITILLCGLKRGSKVLVTLRVPVKLVFIVTRACSANGSVAARLYAIPALLTSTSIPIH